MFYRSQSFPTSLYRPIHKLYSCQFLDQLDSCEYHFYLDYLLERPDEAVPPDVAALHGQEVRLDVEVRHHRGRVPLERARRLLVQPPGARRRALRRGRGRGQPLRQARARKQRRRLLARLPAELVRGHLLAERRGLLRAAGPDVGRQPLLVHARLVPRLARAQEPHRHLPRGAEGNQRRRADLRRRGRAHGQGADKDDRQLPRPHPVQERLVQVPDAQRVGAARRVVRHRAGRDCRACRPLGQRQVDSRAAPPQVLRRRQRRGPLRRGPAGRARPALGTQGRRRRAAGPAALRNVRAREHLLLAQQRLAGGSRARRRGCARRQVHTEAAGRLREQRRREGRRAQRRAEAAHCNRARSPEGPGRAHHRRGDVGTRLREREKGAARARQGDGGEDVPHHCPQARHNSRSQDDLRVRVWKLGGEGNARGARQARRPLLQPGAEAARRRAHREPGDTQQAR